MQNVEEGEISEGGQLRGGNNSDKKPTKPAMRPESLELLREPLKAPRNQSDKPKSNPRDTPSVPATNWKPAPTPSTRPPPTTMKPSRAPSRDDTIYRGSVSEPYPPSSYYRDSSWVDPVLPPRYDDLETREREILRSSRGYDYYSYDDPPPASSYDYDRYGTDHRSSSVSGKGPLPVSRNYTTGSIDLYDYDYGYSGSRSEGWNDYPPPHYSHSHSYSRDYDVPGGRPSSIPPERDYDYGSSERPSRSMSMSRDRELLPPSTSAGLTSQSREHGYARSADPLPARAEGLIPRDSHERSPGRGLSAQKSLSKAPPAAPKLQVPPTGVTPPSTAHPSSTGVKNVKVPPSAPKLHVPPADLTPPLIAQTSSASGVKSAINPPIASPPRPVAMKRSISNDEYVPQKKLQKTHPDKPLSTLDAPHRAPVGNTTSISGELPRTMGNKPLSNSGYKLVLRTVPVPEAKSPEMSVNSAVASVASSHNTSPPPSYVQVQETVKESEFITLNDKPRPALKVSSDEITKPKDIIPPKVPVVASVNSGPVAVTSNPINPIVMDRPRLFDRNKTDQSHQSVPSTAVIPPVQKPPALTKPAVSAVPEPTQIVYTLPTAQLDNKSTLSDIHTGFTNPSFFGTVTAPSNTVVERSELIRSSSLLSDDGGTPAVAPQATQPQRRPRASWGKGLIIQQPKVVEEPRKPVEVPETIEEEKAKTEEILVKEEKETSKNDFSVKMESEEGNVSTNVEKETEVVEVEQDIKVEMDEENTNEQEKTEEEQLREQNEEENRHETQEEEESVAQVSNKVRKRNRSQRNEPEDSDNEEETVPEAQKDQVATVDSTHLSSDEAELPQRKKRGRPFTVKDPSPPTSPRKPVAVKEEVHVRDVSPVPSLKEQAAARGATANNTAGRGRGGRGRGGGRWANRHIQQEVVAITETEEVTSKKPAVSAPVTTTVAPTAKKGATAKEKKPTAASTAVAIAERHHLGNIFSRETDIHRAYNTMAYILELQKTQITDTSNQRAISNLAMVSNLFQGIKTVQAASKLSIPRSSEICYALDLVDTNLEVYYTLLGNQRAKQYLTEMSIKELDKYSQQVQTSSKLTSSKEKKEQEKEKEKIATAEKTAMSPSYLHRFSKSLLRNNSGSYNPPVAAAPVATTSALSTTARSLLALKKKKQQQGLLDPKLKETLQEIQRNNQMRIVEAHFYTTVVNQGTPVIQGNPARLREPQQLAEKAPTSESSIVATTPVKGSSANASTPTAASGPIVTLDDRLKAGEMNLASAANSIIRGQVILPLISETVQEYITGNKAVYQDPRELPSYEINLKTIQRNRHIITKEIRQRKLARRKAWEQLSNTYLAIQHKWNAHISQVEKEEDEIANREGPKLRGSVPTSTSMRSTASASDLDLARYHSRSFSALRGSGGAAAAAAAAAANAVSAANAVIEGATAATSTRSQSTNYLGINVARSDYEQDRLLLELAAQELRQRRIEQGMCGIPEMISPWYGSADPYRQPRIPRWPDELRQFDIDDDTNNGMEEVLNDALTKYPKFKQETNEVVDTSSHRLTTDGKRQLCSSLPITTPCPLECNCAVQVERYLSLQRCWSDIEKAIFIDKFLQYPKNFHKISTFLKNRTTKDCIKFYYDSKSTIEFKLLLKEFDNRRKLNKSNWNYSIKASHLIGSSLYPISLTSLNSGGNNNGPNNGNNNNNNNNEYNGNNNKREALVELPSNDATFTTFTIQPPHTGKTFNFPVSLLFHKGNLENEDGRTVITQTYPRQQTIRQSVRKRMDDFLAEEVDNIKRDTVDNSMDVADDSGTTHLGRRQLFREAEEVTTSLRIKKDYAQSSTSLNDDDTNKRRRGKIEEILPPVEVSSNKDSEEDIEYDEIDCKVDELLLDYDLITTQTLRNTNNSSSSSVLPMINTIMKEPFNKKFLYYQNKKFSEHLLSSYRYNGGLLKRTFLHDMTFGITNNYRENYNTNNLPPTLIVQPPATNNAVNMQQQGRLNPSQMINAATPNNAAGRSGDESVEQYQGKTPKSAGGPGATGGRKSGRGEAKEGVKSGRGVRKTNSSTTLLEMMSAAGESIHLEGTGAVGRPPNPAGRGGGRSGRGRGRGGRGNATVASVAAALSAQQAVTTTTSSDSVSQGSPKPSRPSTLNDVAAIEMKRKKSIDQQDDGNRGSQQNSSNEEEGEDEEDKMTVDNDLPNTTDNESMKDMQSTNQLAPTDDAKEKEQDSDEDQSDNDENRSNMQNESDNGDEEDDDFDRESDENDRNENIPNNEVRDEVEEEREEDEEEDGDDQNAVSGNDEGNGNEPEEEGRDDREITEAVSNFQNEGSAEPLEHKLDDEMIVDDDDATEVERKQDEAEDAPPPPPPSPPVDDIEESMEVDNPNEELDKVDQE